MEWFLELSAARSKTQASPDTALQSLGLPQEQYDYDPVGNRTSSAHQPGFWRYNADNQLTEYPSLKPFSLGALPVDTDVSYTPHGHTQTETNRLGVKEYDYNAAERLIRFANTLQGQTTPQLEAQYRYDPFGRRIAKTVTQGSQTSTVWFIYSEQGLMAEANEQGELTKAYGFNPTTGQQGLWSTDPIWQANIAEHQLTSEQTRYHYLHTDHLYTPMLATDTAGDISWKAVQEAFGAVNALQHQSRINMNLRFPGQYYDQETGTHYNFHRDYKPNAGRYVQSDPIGLEGGVNSYGYVGSSPVTRFDPEGLITWTGTYTRTDFIVGIGSSLSTFELMSECVDGKQAKVDVMAVGPGVGFALDFDTPIFSVGNVCFKDRLSNVNPHVFNGFYSSYYTGFTAIVYGAAFEIPVLGKASNCKLFGQGLSFGLSVGYSYVLGSSTVRSVEWKECGCE